jgi:hypothetical protein
MFRKIGPTLCAVVFSLLAGAPDAAAQVVSVPSPTAATPDAIVVTFPNVIKAMDKLPPPDPGGAASAPLISFKQGTTRTFLTADAMLIRNSTRSAQIRLSNFKTLVGAHPVDLARGSTDDRAAAVPAVGGGDERVYLITWEDVQLEGQPQGDPVLTSATVGSAVKSPPVIFVNSELGAETDIQEPQRKFALSSDAVNLGGLIARFRNNLDRIRVTLNFDKNDPAPGATNNSIPVRVERLEGLRRVVQPDGTTKNVSDDANPEQVIITLSRSLPQRAAAYTVKFEFPTADLNEPGVLKPGFAAPTTEEFVSASDKIEADAPPTERAKTEFYFETTFTSIVNATNRKRENVGLFGLHFKPVVGLRFFGVGAEPGRTVTPEEVETRRPRWIALRPLFDADVDTQRVKDSQAPNRIVFGTDFEYGIAASRRGHRDAIQQYVFLNGVRYDSDRDFKAQTLYWQTEFQPQFLNFDLTREQLLRHSRRPCDPDLLASAIAKGVSTALTPEQCKDKIKSRARQFPLVSMYYVRPSVGYQLGGVIKKGDADSDRVSRLFVKFSTALELKRLVLFSLDDTYYFLQDAERRRNRNYLETRLDFNTGALFNVDLGSLQSAVTFKFQRGELPPRFKPVNALSVGFKLYR